MAVTELVAFTTGRAESAEQTIGDGEVHTLIPRFGGGGRIEILAKQSDGEFQILDVMSGDPAQPRIRQLQGPIEYKAAVKNAGLDLDSGA